MRNTPASQTGTPLTTAEIRNLQVIENNPFTAADEAMFEMFERENWTSEQRRTYIKNLHREAVPELAAE